MSCGDFDGILNSLSLADSPGYEIRHRFHDDSDDRMEIDSIDDPMQPEVVEPEVDEVIECKPARSEPERFESKRLPSILSPTTLGAQLAVRPRLLLMPPPDPKAVSNNEFDYEYTLSRLPKATRNVSSFNSQSNIKSFLEKENASFDTIPSYNNPSQDTLRDNAMTRSYNYRKSMVNTQNYSDELGRTQSLFDDLQPLSRHMPLQIAQPSPAPVVHHHHYYYGNEVAKVPSSVEETRLEKRSEQYSDRHNGQVQLYDTNVELPQPWSPTSRPSAQLPYVLSSYLQLAANALVFMYGAYLVWVVVSSIKQDVAFRISQQALHIAVEIESCRRSYYENNCDPDLIVPALERQCAYWHKCMSQDPTRTGNMSSISANTIGILINSLVEPLGLKFFCVVSAFIVVIFGCNFSFGYIRAKSYYGWDTKDEQLK